MAKGQGQMPPILLLEARCLKWYIFGYVLKMVMKLKLILKSGKPKRLIGLKVHHDGFKPANSLEWWIVGASVR